MTLGQRIAQLAAWHPRAARLVTWGLIVWALWGVETAVELHIRTGDLIGAVQREASERLGG